MSKKTTYKRSTAAQEEIVISDKNLEMITRAVTQAILEAEEKKSSMQATCEQIESKSKPDVKQILRFLFLPIKRIKPENSAISLVKITTSLACWLVSKLGYFFAIVLWFVAIVLSFTDPISVATLTYIYALPVGLIIWVMARMIAAAGVEIENSNNQELIFNLSAFLFAIIAIVISLWQNG